MSSTDSNEDLVLKAIRRGAQNYFESCRQRVPSFINEHYRYPGAWRTNRVAFGLDILRAPLNLFWAPCYVSIYLTGLLFNFCGAKFIGKWLHRTPGGLKTQLQRKISKLISVEVFQHDKHHPITDYIEHAIAESLEAKQRISSEHQQTIREVVEDSLKQYEITRTAASDISNTLMGTAIGALAFKKFTPGGLGIAVVLAYLIEKKLAVSSFFLGDTLGGAYYALFPPQPSFGLIAGATALVLAIFAVFAAISGLITDPIQSRLGIHKHRLIKLINSQEKDFNNRTSGSFRPKDQYVARLLEIFDAIKTHIG